MDWKLLCVSSSEMCPAISTSSRLDLHVVLHHHQQLLHKCVLFQDTGDSIDAVAHDLYDFFEDSSMTSRQEKYRDIAHGIANKLTHQLVRTRAKTNRHCLLY